MTTPEVVETFHPVGTFHEEKHLRMGVVAVESFHQVDILHEEEDF